MRIKPTNVELGPPFYEGFKGIKRINVHDLVKMFPGYDPLKGLRLLVSGIQVPGQMTFAELGVVVSIVRATGATSFAQIGTYDGSTVLNLLENCPDLSSIVTVDLPAALHAAKGEGTVYPTDRFNASMLNVTEIGNRFQNHPRAKIVSDVRKDSALLRPEDFAVAPEVFFIDGSHSYAYCMSDTRIARKVLARPGILIWHDFGQVDHWPEVTRALTEIAEEGEYSLYWLRAFPETTLVFGVRNEK
jgi:methyltransferase family protein